MLRTCLVTAAIACALALPASAQNTMSGPAPAAAPSSAMTCDQMMVKEQSMTMHANGARMTMAQNHMHLATMAKQKNDEAGCKMHVQKAMDLMK